MTALANHQCHVVNMFQNVTSGAVYAEAENTLLHVRTHCSVLYRHAVISIAVPFLLRNYCYCDCVVSSIPQAEAQTRLAADGAPPAPSLVNPGNSSASSIYPPTQRTASGVYSLLSYGVVPPSHPEHPDSFIPHLIKWEADASGSGASMKTRLQRVNSPAVPALHRPSGRWSSGFGGTLEDAYRDRGAAAPRFTTKTRYSIIDDAIGCV